MPKKITRRDFVGIAGGVAAAGLGAAAGAGLGQAAAVPGGKAELPDPAKAPFDTVVVLMMENRSFDHVLGWLPGANGAQAGLSYPDRDGVLQATWPLAPDFQGCAFDDPDHSWMGIAGQYADGRCDGFLNTAKPGDHFPIGYYDEHALPIMAALAKGYTTFDAYFCSMMGPTWENRLFQLSGTTQMDDRWCDFPREGERRPVTIETTIFDRMREAGLTAGYYFHDAPVTGLFASRKYDDISHPIEKFWVDAREGKLPNVVFIDPDYTDRAEDMGTSNDYHPWGNVRVAEGFLAQVHDTLKAGPQWERMVFVLNFDEHGGFYDHVVPPSCIDDTVLPGPGPHPDLKRLGFRVPAIAMGPFAPSKIEQAGPYEHCSVLKMIEWRWGLEPMTARDRHAKNLAEALDFTVRRAAVELPAFEPPPARACAAGGGWLELAATKEGLVRVLCEGLPGAACFARLVALESGEEFAATPVESFGQASKRILDLALSPAARQALAASPGAIPVVLETTVTGGGLPDCRSVFSTRLKRPVGG